jgi:hypothetical protein
MTQEYNALKTRFKKMDAANPALGLYYVLKLTVTNKKYSKKSVTCALKELVPKSDYDSTLFDKLLEDLISATLKKRPYKKTK